MQALIWSLLGYAVYPAWLVTGMVEFTDHQRTLIASTSGVRESLLHVAQMVQNGIPVLVALFSAAPALAELRQTWRFASSLSGV